MIVGVAIGKAPCARLPVDITHGNASPLCRKNAWIARRATQVSSREAGGWQPEGAAPEPTRTRRQNNSAPADRRIAAFDSTNLDSRGDLVEILGLIGSGLVAMREKIGCARPICDPGTAPLPALIRWYPPDFANSSDKARRHACSIHFGDMRLRRLSLHRMHAPEPTPGNGLPWLEVWSCSCSRIGVLAAAWPTQAGQPDVVIG
jgi:hypothetical protein